MIPFVKTEALGNDFILVPEDSAAGTEYAELARRLCHRRLGVGADGLILWTGAPGSEDSFQLRIFNMDGSEAECSGNGLRCMAAYLFQDSRVDGPVHLETVAGMYTLERVADRYTADMGVPSLRPETIPFRTRDDLEQIVDYPLAVGAEEFRITACATGNPHCSLFVERLEPEMLERLGPAIEKHAAFPNGTNVEFIQVLNRSELAVGFWERGAGKTPASGTGSCGATVASVLNDRTGRHVRVHTENGDLEVEWGENGRLRLTANANVVAEGRYLL